MGLIARSIYSRLWLQHVEFILCNLTYQKDIFYAILFFKRKKKMEQISYINKVFLFLKSLKFQMKYQRTMGIPKKKNVWHLKNFFSLQKTPNKLMKNLTKIRETKVLSTKHCWGQWLCYSKEGDHFQRHVIGVKQGNAWG